MNTLHLGLGLMALGIVIFVFARARSKTSSAQASGGSIAVGGNNSGQISNVSVNSQEKAHGSGHSLTIFAIVVELAGIAVTIWHAMHLASK
jgi:hypothetical protein